VPPPSFTRLSSCFFRDIAKTNFTADLATLVPVQECLPPPGRGTDRWFWELGQTAAIGRDRTCAVRSMFGFR